MPTGLAAGVSIADTQFGAIRRPTADEALKVWRRNGWDERPDTILPFLSYVSLSDAQTVPMSTDSSREYQVIGGRGGTLAVTLLATCAWLGKADLVRRPGRPSGIHAAAPDAEVLGRLRLALALRIDAVPFERANVAAAAKAYLTPVVSYNQTPFEAIRLNPATVRLAASGTLPVPAVEGTVQSAVKVSEDDAQILVRLYNPRDEDIPLPAAYRQLNLDETEAPATTTLRRNQVVTLCVGRTPARTLPRASPSQGGPVCGS